MTLVCEVRKPTIQALGHAAEHIPLTHHVPRCEIPSKPLCKQCNAPSGHVPHAWPNSTIGNSNKNGIFERAENSTKMYSSQITGAHKYVQRLPHYGTIWAFESQAHLLQSRKWPWKRRRVCRNCMGLFNVIKVPHACDSTHGCSPCWPC